jgi:hypothetical protein
MNLCYFGAKMYGFSVKNIFTDARPFSLRSWL